LFGVQRFPVFFAGVAVHIENFIHNPKTNARGLLSFWERNKVRGYAGVGENSPKTTWVFGCRVFLENI